MCIRGNSDGMDELPYHGRHCNQTNDNNSSARTLLTRPYLGTPYTISLLSPMSSYSLFLLITDIDIQHMISTRRWRQVDNRMLALFLLVTDAARPGLRGAFVAALGGRLLVPSAILTRKAGHCVAIRYERDLRLPWYL